MIKENVQRIYGAAVVFLWFVTISFTAGIILAFANGVIRW